MCTKIGEHEKWQEKIRDDVENIKIEKIGLKN